MGFFSSRKPKLASYAAASLDALLQDPEWAYPISQAGIDPSACEIVIRISAARIGLGRMAGVPVNASPAILFGQGTTLAMAYPTEREVVVQRRDTSRAELQTQRSGWFQILFGPPDNLDGFMFWGAPDNLQEETAEGKMFGAAMLAFLRGQLQPQQIVGTPQSLVATKASVAPPAPEFSDPEDKLRWDMAQSVKGALDAMMNSYGEVFEQAENIEKAYGMANADYVDGVQQHPISKENFRKMAVRMEEELPGKLMALREATTAAASQWNDFLFLLPGDEAPMLKLLNWCSSHGVASETSSAVIGNVALVHANFGLTRESFLTENKRVIAIMSGDGQQG